MSDTVKIIVTLSKGQYENLKNIQCGSIGSRMIVNAVKNGTPFDGMTNGEVIQALFPNAFYNGGKLFMHIINVNNIGEITIPWRWWNAPYQKGGEE